MSFPAGVQTVLVQPPANGYRTLDGDYQQGTITLTPTVPEVVSAEHGIIAVGAVNFVIGASGMFTPKAVLPNDAEGFTTGWTYRLDTQLTGETPRSYNVLIPASAGSVDLSTLVEMQATDGIVVSVPGGGHGGTPSDTVTAETSYGQAATAGASTDYARGDHTHGTPALPPTGTTAGTYAAGNDARLSDTRTPTPHAASHASGGTDPLTPAAIGADPSGAATSAVTTHTQASDPHGDRAFATSTFATTTTVSTLNAYVDDTTNRIAAVENGTAWLSAVHVAGDAEVSGGDLTVHDPAKGYRFRRSGSALDLEATGADLLVSNWSGTGFNGTQHSYLRISSDAQNIQIAGRVESVAALYGAAVHTLDPATGVAALGAVNGLANTRLAGRRSSPGAPTTGAWSTGDTVQDSAGSWWVCTAGGSPGTWSGVAVRPWVVDVTASVYGAKGDAKVISDGAITTGTAVLTSPSNGFAGAAPGMYVSVKGAGPTGVTTHIARIATTQSNGQITLDANAATTVSGAIVIFGTDDTPAIQAAVDAAEAYLAAGNTYAQVFFPPRPYIVAGALNTSKSGNGQIVFGPVPVTSNKRILEFRGATDGAAAVRHWQQTVPQYAGSCLISLGVYASTSAQTSSINAAGNPGVICGPTEAFGYGVSSGGAVFSNMMAVIRNLSIITTHSSFGLTYGAANLWGVANCHIENFGYGTAGLVTGTDYSSPGVFGTGLSVGLALPAPGNNDHVIARNISCGGGYTYGLFLTEHAVVDRYMALYCWAGLCPVGTYRGSVGSVHAMDVLSASIEACANMLYIIGAGSSGVGPTIRANISTESSTPNIAGNSQTAVNSALGQVRLTGLFTESGVTTQYPTGIEIIDGQIPRAIRRVTSAATARPIDRTLICDTTAGGAFTVTLPAADFCPVEYVLRNAGTNALTVASTGSQTIYAPSTATATATVAAGGTLRVQALYNGSAWGWYAV